MNRLLLYWFIILLVSLFGCTSKTIDKDAQARNDTIKKYLDLAGNVNLDFEKRKQYNNKAYSYLDFTKNDSLTRCNLYSIGINNNNLMQFKKLEKNANKLFDLSFKSNEQLCIAYAYRLLGINHMNKSENEKAIESLYKSKKIFIKLNYTGKLISLNNDIAQVQYYSCDFLGSNKTLFENLELIEKSNKKSHSWDLHNDYEIISSNFFSLKDYNNSIRFKKKAIECDGNKLRYVNSSYLGIANSYIELKDYDKANFYINKILSNPKSEDLSPLNFHMTKSTLCYLRVLQNKINGLLKVFQEVEHYYSKNESSDGQNYNQIYLSEYYAKVRDTLNAIKTAQKANEISKSYKNPTDILCSLDQLIKVDKKNASTNAREYIRINDSLQIAERRFRDKFAQIVYETNEISKQKETAIKQIWIIVTIAGAVILIIALLLIITRQRSKQNKMQFQQSQQKANEEIYDLMLNQKNKEEQARQSEKKRIAIELHDGVMNRLASTRLNLNMLSFQKDEETINNCLNHIEGIYKIEQEIRNIAHDLNTEIFNETNSFVAMLNDFVATQNATTSSKYKLENDAALNWNHISSGIKMNLYRIIQEASHNVNKYAQATNVIISLVLDMSNICLSVTDNGKGFDTNVNSEGIGLKNIKLRVESLKGKIVIKSNNKSTSINITIPLATV